jgi:hypothetical protein
MRNRTALSFALILGLVAALGLSPTLIAAQETDQGSLFSDGVDVTLDKTDKANGQKTQAIIATFEAQAYAPERTNPEAMVVKVLKGTLAFRVQSPDVVLDAQGNEIQLVTSKSPIGFGQAPSATPATGNNDPDVRFSPGGPMPTSTCSQTVSSFCALNPATFSDLVTFVVLESGYTVFLPAGSTCFFCNVTPTSAGDQTAQLLYWTSAQGLTITLASNSSFPRKQIRRFP